MKKIAMYNSNYRQNKFARSALTYHKASFVQKSIANRLIGFVKYLHLDYDRSLFGLEIACGTGHLTEQIFQKIPNIQWTISDISKEMLELCQERLIKEGLYLNSQWDTLDANHFSMKKLYSLITSNLVVQWFQPITSHLKCIWNSLEKEGFYLFSGLNTDNFFELKSILQEQPFSVNLEVGHGEAEISDALEKVGFERCFWMQETLDILYPSVHCFLHSLKNFGGSGIPNLKMTPQKLKELEFQYISKYSKGNSICATWRPWYVIAKKMR